MLSIGFDRALDGSINDSVGRTLLYETREAVSILVVAYLTVTFHLVA